MIVFVICKKAVPEKIKKIEGGREGARKKEDRAKPLYTLSADRPPLREEILVRA